MPVKRIQLEFLCSLYYFYYIIFILLLFYQIRGWHRDSSAVQAHYFYSFAPLCRKLLSIIMLISFIIVFGVSIALEKGKPSYFSHVGGIMFGVFSALAWMPKDCSSSWRMAWTLLGVVSLIVSISVLFAYFYIRIFPSIQCWEDDGPKKNIYRILFFLFAIVQ